MGLSKFVTQQLALKDETSRKIIERAISSTLASYDSESRDVVNDSKSYVPKVVGQLYVPKVVGQLQEQSKSNVSFKGKTKANEPTSLVIGQSLMDVPLAERKALRLCEFQDMQRLTLEEAPKRKPKKVEVKKPTVSYFQIINSSVPEFKNCLFIVQLVHETKTQKDLFNEKLKIFLLEELKFAGLEFSDLNLIVKTQSAFKTSDKNGLF